MLLHHYLGHLLRALTVDVAVTGVEQRPKDERRTHRNRGATDPRDEERAAKEGYGAEAGNEDLPELDVAAPPKSPPERPDDEESRDSSCGVEANVERGCGRPSEDKLGVTPIAADKLCESNKPGEHTDDQGLPDRGHSSA